jgi:hypothetical protein
MPRWARGWAIHDERFARKWQRGANWAGIPRLRDGVMGVVRSCPAAELYARGLRHHHPSHGRERTNSEGEGCL